MTQRLRDLADVEELAQALATTFARLSHYFYLLPEERRVREFTVRKRNGKLRPIVAPIAPIKVLQRRLLELLEREYTPKNAVHGFTRGRSVVTNAQLHVRAKWILNVDLEDFFPSITFPRVYGMLKAEPYAITPAVAAVVAQMVCCVEGRLPQGAPTSPIISNMICARLDRQLGQLARSSKVRYTRYADDLSFSTSRTQFPPELARLRDSSDSTSVELGQSLRDVIQDNGFRSNRDKLRLRHCTRRQEVTGLTVNHFPNVRREYVRNLRAILHACRKHGIDGAQQLFHEKYWQRRSELQEPPDLRAYIRGKLLYLSMVRADSPSFLRKLVSGFGSLDATIVQGIRLELPSRGGNTAVHLHVEGPSDRILITAALAAHNRRGDFADLTITFVDAQGNGGSQDLLQMCRSLAKVPQGDRHVFVFDRDEPAVLKVVDDPTRGYKVWGNNVYSLPLPIPPFRLATDAICVEHLLKDEQLTVSDSEGRRLFLPNEFNHQSQRHRSLKLICTDRNALRRHQVIDHDVYDESDRNVALQKVDFANLVAARLEQFDFEGFRPLFAKLAELRMHRADA